MQKHCQQLAVNLKSSNNKKQKRLNGLTDGFLILLVYELTEEILESIIATAITTAIGQGLQFLLSSIQFLIVALTTQTLKIITKSVIRVLKPLVKTYTKKGGNDKIIMMKNIFCWIKGNVLPLLGVLAVMATATIQYVNTAMSMGLELVIGGNDILPYITYGSTAVLGITNFFVNGFHKVAPKCDADSEEVAKIVEVPKTNDKDIDDYINNI